MFKKHLSHLGLPSKKFMSTVTIPFVNINSRGPHGAHAIRLLLFFWYFCDVDASSDEFILKLLLAHHVSDMFHEDLVESSHLFRIIEIEVFDSICRRLRLSFLQPSTIFLGPGME